MGYGVGRRYEFKTSSPVAAELTAGAAGSAGAGAGADVTGDEGVGVARADKLLDDLLLWDRLGELRRPSSDTDDGAFLPRLDLLEVPLSRALLQVVSIILAQGDLRKGLTCQKRGWTF